MKDKDLFGSLADLNNDVDAKVLFIHLAALDQMLVDEENKKRKISVKRPKVGEIAEEDLGYMSSNQIMEALRNLAKRYFMPEFSLETT
jgi:hypothetical protein